MAYVIETHAQEIAPMTTEGPQGSRPRVPPDLLNSLQEIRHHHWIRLNVFIILYLTAGLFAHQIIDHHQGSFVVYLACVPLFVIAAASLHGISLFTHEGVHSTLCRSPIATRIVSVLCALPVLQNFAAYKVLHLKHHQHLGSEGDPDHYPNYTRWTWLIFAMNWGRLLIGYPAYIIAIPILGYRQGKRADRFWIAFELLLLFMLIAGVALSPVPWKLLFHVWLIPMLIINTLVNVRGMSQHTFLEHHSDPVLGTRSILTNPIVSFFMCNENYHLEHHLYPGVPWHNLARLHGFLKSDLVARGAPYIPSYFAFVREFVAGSIRRSPLGKNVSGAA